MKTEACEQSCSYAYISYVIIGLKCQWYHNMDQVYFGHHIFQIQGFLRFFQTIVACLCCISPWSINVGGKYMKEVNIMPSVLSIQCGFHPHCKEFLLNEILNFAL